MAGTLCPEFLLCMNSDGIVGSLGLVYALVDQDPFVVDYAQGQIWIGAAWKHRVRFLGHLLGALVGVVEPMVEVKQSIVVAPPIAIELNPQARHHVAQELGLL